MQRWPGGPTSRRQAGRPSCSMASSVSSGVHRPQLEGFLMPAAPSDHATVVASLYAAAGRPELWPETLTLVADHVGAMGGMLTYHDLADNTAWIATARLRE